LTAALKPLDRRGLVSIAADASDRRVRRMKLTQQGETLLAEAVPIWERTSQEVEALLPDGDSDRLRNNLLALS